MRWNIGLIFAALALAGCTTSREEPSTRPLEAPSAGAILRLDEVNGSVLWRTDLTTAGVGTPTLAGRLVVLLDETGNLHTFDSSSGTAEWSESGSGSGIVLSPPVVTEGAVYFRSGKDLLAVESETGQELWRFSTDGDVGYQFSNAQGLVFASVLSRGDPESWLVAVDQRTGSEVWRYGFEPRGAPTNGPLATNGSVVVAGNDGRVRSFDGATGEVRWEIQAGTRNVAVYNVSETNVYVQQQSFSPEERREILALDPDTGATKWRVATTTESTSDSFPIPAESASRAFVIQDKGVVAAVDALTGAEIWSATLARGRATTIAAGDDLVLVGGTRYLTALDAATGKKRWGTTVQGGGWVFPYVFGGQVFASVQGVFPPSRD